MNNEEIIRLNREYTIFSWAAQAAVDPIPVARAEGVYLWDANDRRYLDFSSQLMNVNIGHSHPRVIQAIKDQADRLLFAAPAFATQPRGELGQALAAIAPGASYGPSKLWPVASFARVADALVRAGARVAVLGAPGEAALTPNMHAPSAPPAINGEVQPC